MILLKTKLSLYTLWGFKVFHSQLSKEIESSVDIGENQSIQRNQEQGKRTGFRDRKRINQCNKDGNCTGNKSSLSFNTSSSFGVLQVPIQSAEINESTIERKNWVVKYLWKIKDNAIKCYTLIDCRATEIVLIDKELIYHHQIKKKILSELQELEVIDERLIEFGIITTMAKQNLTICGYQEQLTAFITKLRYYSIVLELLLL